ncbi:hypothetical protein NMY22_g14659 [Coprinellus aureogranulatus]|nr:hypothetical protein NMY22_g14659 [Coprinellus aureogranulatus]
MRCACVRAGSSSPYLSQGCTFSSLRSPSIERVLCPNSQHLCQRTDGFALRGSPHTHFPFIGITTAPELQFFIGVKHDPPHTPQALVGSSIHSHLPPSLSAIPTLYSSFSDLAPYPGDQSPYLCFACSSTSLSNAPGAYTTTQPRSRRGWGKTLLDIDSNDTSSSEEEDDDIPALIPIQHDVHSTAPYSRYVLTIFHLGFSESSKGRLNAGNVSAKL